MIQAFSTETLSGLPKQKKGEKSYLISVRLSDGSHATRLVPPFKADHNVENTGQILRRTVYATFPEATDYSFTDLDPKEYAWIRQQRAERALVNSAIKAIWMMNDAMSNNDDKIG